MKTVKLALKTQTPSMLRHAGPLRRADTLVTTNTKLLSRDYILIMAAVVGTSFVNNFFFSTLSLFAETLTGTARYAGYLSLAYSATALVIRPLSGILSDKHGRVKLIIGGAVICTVSCFLYSFTTGLVLLLMIRILNGIGMGMNQTCAGAAVPDIVPKERLAQGIGIFGLYSTVAQAVGPFIALAIVGNGELRNFRTLFYVATAFCGVSFVCSCFIRYERDRKRESTSAHEPAIASETKDAVSKQAPASAAAQSNTEIKTILGVEPQVLGLVIMLMLYFVGVSGILSFLTLYAKNRGFPIEYLGFYFFVNAGGVFASRMIFGRIVDRRGGDIVIIPGLIVIASCLAIIPIVPSLPFLICMALPYGLASGAVGPALNSAMFKRCSPKRRGAVSATYFVAVDIGITVGTPIMGLIADYIGFNWVYWLSSAIVCVAFLLYILIGSDKNYERRLAKPT